MDIENREEIFQQLVSLKKEISLNLSFYENAYRPDRFVSHMDPTLLKRRLLDSMFEMQGRSG